MNTSSLKSFAPEVRRQLMEAVERRLDYVLTADTADLRTLELQISALRREADKNRKALVERVAYTWFNRLAALRFLDARGWHPFKARVLTPATPDETQPEILKLLRSGSLPEELRPHTDLARLNDLLDGRLPTAIAGADPQGEAYRGLILAACRCYHALMPFLFEAIDDETELLLPDDLLTATSVAEGFRTEITDADCSEVEILGWLYQFYISEKKDAVMARKKAVPSEDIPAVTQLFTPHWIVRYLVENSLGRLWLRSRPNSRLKEYMPYYVEDPEVNAKSESLTVEKPEDIRLLDPASGSGHMLTYAFDLLVKIYEEEGHAPSEIPEQILTHNLFGLEICPRAAQLAQFALVCKAREQSRTAFRRPVQPQVMCLQNVVVTPDEIQAWSAATGVKLGQDELSQLHQFRENTETFGALTQPVLDGEKLAALGARIGEQAPAGDLLVQNTHRKLRLVLDQAEMLSQRYQVVVANPPYMKSDNFNAPLKSGLANRYKVTRTDLFAIFMERLLDFALPNGSVAMITMQTWMFKHSYQDLRNRVINGCSILSLVQLGTKAFKEIGGEVVQTCGFVLCNTSEDRDLTTFVRLTDGDSDAKEQNFLDGRNRYHFLQEDFNRIPQRIMVYWTGQTIIRIVENFPCASDLADFREGIHTGDNPRFIRQWHEIENRVFTTEADSPSAIDERNCRWVPYNKGGTAVRWYGGNEFVLAFDSRARSEMESLKSHVRPSQGLYFKEGGTWPDVGSLGFGVRYYPRGFLFDQKGPVAVGSNIQRTIAALNSVPFRYLASLMMPTLSYRCGTIKSIPIPIEVDGERLEILTADSVSLARSDWDNFETSWDFRDLPLLRPGDWKVEPGQAGGEWKGRTLAESWANYASYCAAAIRRMQELETENNRLWIDAYGLQDELDPAVPPEEITLARADARKDMAAFLSYAVGCMTGRYSLDHPGLILADAGDTVENYLAKVGKPLDQLAFPPDEDAIIPVLEGEWFEDDIVARTREFLRVTFGEATLHENLRFIEQSLGKDLRKYFLTDFYKNHISNERAFGYKNRPIYWLFQSPKKGFGALVYLHRYTRDTVNTLLNDYLRDFLKKLESRIDHLAHVQDTASSAREKSVAAKDEAKLKKTLKECREWERDVLLPLAQQRLEIDLDDGVKANYPKFGKALAPIAGLATKE